MGSVWIVCTNKKEGWVDLMGEWRRASRLVSVRVERKRARKKARPLVFRRHAASTPQKGEEAGDAQISATVLQTSSTRCRWPSSFSISFHPIHIHTSTHPLPQNVRAYLLHQLLHGAGGADALQEHADEVLVAVQVQQLAHHLRRLGRRHALHVHLDVLLSLLLDGWVWWGWR